MITSYLYRVVLVWRFFGGALDRDQAGLIIHEEREAHDTDHTKAPKHYVLLYPTLRSTGQSKIRPSPNGNSSSYYPAAISNKYLILRVKYYKFKHNYNKRKKFYRIVI